MRASRVGLLAGVAALALAVGSARAETVPSVEELYRLFKEQQKLVSEQNKLIIDQQKRIQELERRAAKSEGELVRTRQSVRATTEEVTKARREVEATRQDVQQSKTVMATKTDLDRTKAEIGTQPTQSVFRVDPTPPGYMAFGEFIYLRPTTDIVAFTFSTFNFGVTSRSDSVSLEHNYQPGFRVGGGYRFPGGTDVKLIYTFLRTSSTTEASAAAGVTPAINFFSPALSIGACCQNFTANGEVRYRLDYDVVDAEAGLNFMIGSHLRMRGSAGLRFVRIDQTLDGRISSLQAAGRVDSYAELRNEFWGAGPRLGLGGMWDFGSGFGIEGQFGGTLAVGVSRIRSNRQNYTNGNQTSGFDSDGPSSAKLVPGVDAALALTFTQPLGGMMVFKASAGYQFIHWFNMKGFAGGEGSSSSSLSLDGFFLRAGVKW
jgi:hypothetical protein